MHAVRDVSLDVPPGRFVTLLGPSGCGKTTLLRLVAGFERPDAGTIAISGQDVTTTPAHKRPVNTVFQQYALFPHRTVFGNVAFGLEIKGLGRSPALDMRTRLLVLTGQYTMAKSHAALEDTIQAALNAKVPIREIAEVILQCIVYGGHTTVDPAIQVLHRVAAESGLLEELRKTQLPLDGLWVFWRSTCDHCAAHLKHLAETETGTTLITLVRLEEPTDTEANRVVHELPSGNFVQQALLPPIVNYVIETPAELELEGGKVVAARQGVTPATGLTGSK